MRAMKAAMSASHRPLEKAGESRAGRVYWITGLSGAGKTTLGRELVQRLRAAGRPAIFLDGDMLREVIAEDLGHNLANRRKSAMRNARLCRMLASQGADVVCPTISMFHEVQRWNRENIPAYREIYLARSDGRAAAPRCQGHLRGGAPRGPSRCGGTWMSPRSCPRRPI